MEGRCHDLKHESGRRRSDPEGGEEARHGEPPGGGHEDVEKAIRGRGQNKKGRMDYATWEGEDLPIGSGVTEAACKVLVKQRLCGSGMKWKEPGAAAVLSVRCLTYTKERWSQFWNKIRPLWVPGCCLDRVEW